MKPSESRSPVASFRKKPVVIQAVQYHGNNSQEVIDQLGMQLSRDVRFTPTGGLLITTLESNEFLVRPGDWIIKGVKGEFYACKPDIFEMTYESAAIASETANTDWKQRHEEECAIVDRCWKAVGITNYEQAKPYSIDEHIEKAMKDAARYRWLRGINTWPSANDHARATKFDQNGKLLFLTGDALDRACDAGMRAGCERGQSK